MSLLVLSFCKSPAASALDFSFFHSRFLFLIFASLSPLLSFLPSLPSSPFPFFLPVLPSINQLRGKQNASGASTIPQPTGVALTQVLSVLALRSAKASGVFQVPFPPDVALLLSDTRRVLFRFAFLPGCSFGFLIHRFLFPSLAFYGLWFWSVAFCGFTAGLVIVVGGGGSSRAGNSRWWQYPLTPPSLHL